MQRLFVAIRPPRAIREQLLFAMGGIAGARWQTEDQLHITLRFIGEVDRRQSEDIVLALQTIHLAPFEISLNGIGTFDRRGQLTTLWAGLTPQEPLKALHKKVDQACVRAGLEPERRAYHPHITLARLGRSAGPIGGAIGQSGGITSQPFPVSSFGLYESVLTPDGAVYSLLERYQLA
jgi:RNA 2',3'-cyclic 3'-phosphodiesterase